MPNGTLSRSTDSTSAPDIARRLAHWRARIERRRAVQEFKLCVPGAAVVYRLTAPADPDAVLDETISTDPHIPYWATPWASGMALAEVALARLREVVDLRALDLGCGLGLTATALAEAGAGVSAVDCFAESLTFARYNVLRNTGRTLRTHLMDWRTARGARALAGVGADLVVA
ncbi:MAG: class I SAM-dependent methyltransferase, partial [Chloroflexota bacterium]